jgi:hypothetical protein
LRTGEGNHVRPSNAHHYHYRPSPHKLLFFKKKLKKIQPFHHPKVEARSTGAGQAKSEGIMACNKVKPSVQILFCFHFVY